MAADRQRACIRGQDRIGGEEPIEPAEERLLDLELLDDGFDHDRRAGRPVRIRAQGQPLEDRGKGVVEGLAGQATPAKAPAEAVARFVPAPSRSHAGSMSMRLTGWPCSRASWAIPAPIVPAPTTAISGGTVSRP